MSDETKNKPALEDNFAELEDILKQMDEVRGMAAVSAVMIQ